MGDMTQKKRPRLPTSGTYDPKKKKTEESSATSESSETKKTKAEKPKPLNADYNLGDSKPSKSKPVNPFEGYLRPPGPKPLPPRVLLTSAGRGKMDFSGSFGKKQKMSPVLPADDDVKMDADDGDKMADSENDIDEQVDDSPDSAPVSEVATEETPAVALPSTEVESVEIPKDPKNFLKTADGVQDRFDADYPFLNEGVDTWFDSSVGKAPHVTKEMYDLFSQFPPGATEKALTRQAQIIANRIAGPFRDGASPESDARKDIEEAIKNHAADLANKINFPISEDATDATRERQTNAQAQAYSIFAYILKAWVVQAYETTYQGHKFAPDLPPALLEQGNKLYAELQTAERSPNTSADVVAEPSSLTTPAPKSEAEQESVRAGDLSDHGVAKDDSNKQLESANIASMSPEESRRLNEKDKKEQDLILERREAERVRQEEEDTKNRKMQAEKEATAVADATPAAQLSTSTVPANVQITFNVGAPPSNPSNLDTGDKMSGASGKNTIQSAGDFMPDTEIAELTSEDNSSEVNPTIGFNTFVNSVLADTEDKYDTYFEDLAQIEVGSGPLSGPAVATPSDVPPVTVPSVTSYSAYASKLFPKPEVVPSVEPYEPHAVGRFKGDFKNKPTGGRKSERDKSAQDKHRRQHELELASREYAAQRENFMALAAKADAQRKVDQQNAAAHAETLAKLAAEAKKQFADVLEQNKNVKDRAAAKKEIEKEGVKIRDVFITKVAKQNDWRRLSRKNLADNVIRLRDEMNVDGEDLRLKLQRMQYLTTAGGPPPPPPPQDSSTSVDFEDGTFPVATPRTAAGAPPPPPPGQGSSIDTDFFQDPKPAIFAYRADGVLPPEDTPRTGAGAPPPPPPGQSPSIGTNFFQDPKPSRSQPDSAGSAPPLQSPSSSFGGGGPGGGETSSDSFSGPSGSIGRPPKEPCCTGTQIMIQNYSGKDNAAHNAKDEPLDKLNLADLIHNQNRLEQKVSLLQLRNTAKRLSGSEKLLIQGKRRARKLTVAKKKKAANILLKEVFNVTPAMLQELLKRKKRKTAKDVPRKQTGKSE